MIVFFISTLSYLILKKNKQNRNKQTKNSNFIIILFLVLLNSGCSEESPGVFKILPMCGDQNNGFPKVSTS